MDLDEDLRNGFVVEKEETKTRGFQLGGGGKDGDGDGGDGDGDLAFGSETEFFEEDHGAGVGVHGERFDFCGGCGGGENEYCGEEEKEGNVGFPHYDWGWWRSEWRFVGKGTPRLATHT
ncbi:hypothetical protein A2U01_0006763 [Trifolium medium]|uniref:Uncharacterized protein n=1 Tax=Trifolium medium TaxID=97028 RepID=A0A392MF43_9FABA|nr:hypothetical protein [Trifolium medium]